MTLPQQTAAWVLREQKGVDGLEFVQDLPILAIREDEVLLKIYAASLNYRDVVIVKVICLYVMIIPPSEIQAELSQGALGLPSSKADLVPGSDGAGIVQAVGANVKDFAVGDRVCTHLTCGLTEDELPGFTDISSGLGHTLDGTLRQFGVFHKTSLVKMPSNLNFLEAATLTCSGLTAWNALFGLEGKAPLAGSTVLVQGTGGVSIAALQVRSSLLSIVHYN